MIRKLCILGCCAIVATWLFCSQSPSQAQAKKDDLNKQITDLKKKVSDRDQTITQLNNKITATAKTQKQTLKDKDDLIASLQTNDLGKEVTSLRKRVKELDTLKKAPFVHTAILKLKKDDDAQVQKVYDAAGKTLAKIDGVRGLWIGKPAVDGTPELAQKGYHLGLVVLLDDADALQKYLDDPLHKQFTEKMGDYWEKPVVYDFQRDPDADKKKDDKTKSAD
jgi:uncharacterized coiled-coil protein SlyX